MRALALIAVALAGCSPSASEVAKRDYDFLSEQGASLQEMCEAARKVQSAYRDERNSQQYGEWKVRADVTCRRASQTF